MDWLNELAAKQQQKKYNYLLAQGVPLDDPQMLALNPVMAELLQPQVPVGTSQPTSNIIDGIVGASQPAPQPARPFAEQLGAVSQVPAEGIRSIMGILSQLPEQAMGGLNSGIADFLYGLTGDPRVDGVVGATQQQSPPAMPVPETVTAQPPVIAPQQPVATRQPAPVPMQAPAPQNAPQAASVADIASVLLAQPQQQQQLPPTPAKTVDGSDQQWYQNEKGMAWLADVLAGAAMGPNIWQGAVQGNMTSQQRQQQQMLAMQDAFFKQQQLNLEGKKANSTIDLNSANATKAREETSRMGVNDELEGRKTQAEIAKIKAETSLAQAKALAERDPDSVSVKEYNRLLVDLRGNLAEESVLMEEGSEEGYWSPDYRARIALNQTAPQVARYIPLNAEIKARLAESKKALDEGTLDTNVYKSRVQQAALLASPDSVLQYIQSLKDK